MEEYIKLYKDFKPETNEGLNYVDEINNELNKAMKEYHKSMDLLQELQSKFIKIPTEKINEREAIKQQIITAFRDMSIKQDTFQSLLANTGDGDIFNNNSQH